MKKLFLLLAFATVISYVQAQKCHVKDVPAPVTDAFNKAYPDAKKC